VIVLLSMGCHCRHRTAPRRAIDLELEHALRRTQAANLSIVLAATGPLLLLCGFAFRLSYVPPSQIARVDLIGNVLLAAGAAAIGGSFWLSGFAFSMAPRRSLASTLMSVAPVVAYWFFVVRAQQP